jgi:hypothetical protein
MAPTAVTRRLVLNHDVRSFGGEEVEGEEEEEEENMVTSGNRGR